MIEEIRRLKVINHTNFENDINYRIDSLEIKMNAIIESLNKIIQKVNNSK